MAPTDDTDALLAQVSQGDNAALEALLARHKDRLGRMVRVYFDQRMAARMDPSDVVQETLVEAHRRLPAFLQDRPVHFYVWLREIAKQRLIDLQRRHIQAQRRSVNKEAENTLPVSDHSVQELAQVLIVSQTSPSAHVQRSEELARLQTALDGLDAMDREVLTLRYVERVSAREAGAALGISENAFTKRHIRAISRLRTLLGG